MARALPARFGSGTALPVASVLLLATVGSTSGIASAEGQALAVTAVA